MSRPSLVSPGRLVGLLGCSGGALLLAYPHRVAGLVSRGAPPEARLVRLLGGRMLLQGAALAVRPDRRTARVCAAVDATHAASMVAAAGLLPRYRRAALLAAAVAVGSTAADLAVAGGTSR